MSKIHSSVSELIGHTPLLRLHQIEAEFNLTSKLVAKLEFMNPAGSVKDRVALSLIEDGERRGLINKDTVIIEPTSGNTGIGLASVCASRGYRLIIVMPDTMSVERIKLMTAYGAEVILSNGALGMSGAIALANEIAAKYDSAYITGQFTNPANPLAHKCTTGPEIWEDTDGNVDIFVCGIGTGGTVTGTAEYLKSVSSSIQIVGVEPATSAVLSGRSAGAHKIQGIGAGFVPSVLDLTLCDEIIPVSDDDAYGASRLLGKREGVLVGISSGAALSAAITLARRPENEGKTIVVLLPDTGERYLSSDLF